MSAYTKNEEYRRIGFEVIENTKELKHLMNEDVRIEFMASDHKKTSSGKSVLGECFKVQELYKQFCPYDFLIVFYDRNIEGMTEEQLHMLAEHELLHVGVEEKSDGSMRYFIRPHDYDDFKQITDKYGTDWAKRE